MIETSSRSRRIAGHGLIGLVLAVTLLAGCQRRAQTCGLSDRTTPLPEGICLPAGFHPLEGHIGQPGQSDDYGGWPRYIVSERDNMVMCYVPSQQIMMGGGIGADEVPARQVTVNHFYIDLTEVSNSQFHRFAKAVKWHGAKGMQVDHYRDYWEPGFNDSHPARGVSWRQARAYAQWTGKYLPTEAQWEAAARGGDRRIYPWGNDSTVEQTRYLCNARTSVSDFDGYETTAPVMNFAPGVSPFGAFNMAGNVWEWCDDYYDPGRYGYPSQEDPATNLQRGAKAFGDANYPNPIDKDVREARVGPLRGDEHVIRGGSFADPVELCRVETRAGARIDVHQNNIGLRCVLPLPPPDAK